MTESALCLMLAPVLTLVVGLLKRIAFVRDHPKTVAMMLAAIVAAFRVAHPDAVVGVDISGALECLVTLLAGAVATHEVVVEPIKKQIAVGLRHDD